MYMQRFQAAIVGLMSLSNPNCSGQGPTPVLQYSTMFEFWWCLLTYPYNFAGSWHFYTTRWTSQVMQPQNFEQFHEENIMRSWRFEMTLFFIASASDSSDLQYSHTCIMTLLRKHSRLPHISVKPCAHFVMLCYFVLLYYVWHTTFHPCNSIRFKRSNWRYVLLTIPSLIRNLNRVLLWALYFPSF